MEHTKARDSSPGSSDGHNRVHEDPGTVLTLSECMSFWGLILKGPRTPMIDELWIPDS